jgi:hypothetical protein
MQVFEALEQCKIVLGDTVLGAEPSNPQTLNPDPQTLQAPTPSDPNIGEIDDFQTFEYDPQTLESPRPVP